ncbi:MAG TPA: hypothetical protein VE032_06130 [Actinomycetota bacterium]|nr:hypothetical protein [Actinomycetota bacterium]
MSAAPALDASRPAPLRLAGFLLAVVGALLVGIGVVTTWATVGIGGENIHTDIPGVDLPDGKVALGCAVVMLVGILATRMVRSGRAAAAWSGLVIAVGVIAMAIGGAFLVTGLDRSAVVASLPPREFWDAVGAFEDLGTGAILVLLGGVLGFCGGIASLAWAMRGRDAEVPPAEDAVGSDPAAPA